MQEFVIFLLDKKSLHNVLSEFRKNNSKVALCLWLELKPQKLLPLIILVSKTIYGKATAGD